MKKIIGIFLLPFLLFACSDGSSTSPESPALPALPEITGVEFLVKTDSGYLAVNTFQPGGKMNAKIYASDPDRNMSVVEYTLYYPDDDTVLAGPFVENLPAQTHEDMWYSNGDDMTIPPIQGRVKVEIKITDSEGNNSKTFVNYFTVE